jgi:hypothetical protein
MPAFAIVALLFCADLGQDAETIYHDAQQEEQDLQPGLQDEERAYGKQRIHGALSENIQFRHVLGTVDRDELRVREALRGGTGDPYSLEHVSVAQGKELEDGEHAQADYKAILRDMQQAGAQKQASTDISDIVFAVSLFGFVGAYFMNGGWRSA